MGTGHDPSVSLVHFVPFSESTCYLQVSEYIAECARILDKSGLKYQVRTFSTPCLELTHSADIVAAATIRCSTYVLAYSIHLCQIADISQWLWNQSGHVTTHAT